MRAMALNIEHRPRNASEMRDDLYNMAPRAASTVPMIAEDETTRVSLAAKRADVSAPNIERERRPQVVVPVPEETWVARKQRGSGRKWIVGAVILAGLCALSAALYLLFFASNTQRRTASNQPVARSSPRPSPSPAPTSNANQQTNANSPPVATPDEMAARARLAEKKIPYTETVFSRAVEEGDTEAVALFLAAGMKPDVKDSAGRTALINAAASGSNNISQKLLSKGADVNARDNTGATALMQSALGGHKETTKVLLENRADVNLTDNNGQTALIYAAAQGRTEIVRLLLNNGARVDIKDSRGRDALAWAENNDHSDVVDLLKKAIGNRP
jgi:hypothetical protein